MEELSQDQQNFNMRFEIYRLVKDLVLFIAAVLFIKMFLFDTVLIKTDQMSSSIIKGDRIIITKLRYKKPFQDIFHPDYNSTIVFKPVTDSGGLRCLRLGGRPGDVIALSGGKYTLINKPGISLKYSVPDSTQIIPPEYSPRDEMVPFRVPVPGESFLLDTLSMRDFIFISSMIKQEKGGEKIRIKPFVHINDSVVNDYFIDDFILYSGSIDSIPEKFIFNHFFWNKFSQYIKSKESDTVSVSLKLHLFNGSEEIQKYEVKKKFYFLFAQNYLEGYDSRYFGPVSEDKLTGRASFVIWSRDFEKPFFSGLRLTRVFKIIK